MLLCVFSKNWEDVCPVTSPQNAHKAGGGRVVTFGDPRPAQLLEDGDVSELFSRIAERFVADPGWQCLMGEPQSSITWCYRSKK